MSRVLAIDYGSRRVGLAVTDPQQLIATPLDTISPGELMDYLKAYMQKEPVEKIIIGYPLRTDGTSTHATPYVKELLGKLSQEFPQLALQTVDERYTSKMAQRSLLESGAKKKSRARKENLDQISATLILQSYLEAKTYSS